MLIDTHVHYNMGPFYPDWESYWKKALTEGIGKSVVVGADMLSSTIATQIAVASDELYASIGSHPSEYHELFLNGKQSDIPFFDSLIEDVDADLDSLGLLVNDKKVVAIGETGLDYYRLPKLGDERLETIKLQKYAFERHIQLAQEKNLPLILHVRDKETPEEKTEGNAYWDALEILQRFDVKNFTLHCVSGPLSYVKSAVEMGGYMGFDGNITYPNAVAIREIFKIVPEDKRLVETDAPFLPPQEFRGQTCEPWMLKKTVEYITQEFGVEADLFAQNSLILFSKMK